MEEKLNIFSHGIGFLLSIVALVLLVIHASLHGNGWHITSFSIFGVSLITLYGASTLYHYSKKPTIRNRLNIIDHALIYVLIAGTYTPFSLICLSGTTGWVIFGLSWGLAITGIILKIFFTGRFNILSTVMYVLMGWIIIFAIKPLIDVLPLAGFYWLLAGGITYTVGAILYSLDMIKYNHAIFHVFVLMASICQFIAVYIYVLPWS
ncbi:MAG: hemolysin III family protein [Fibrobacteria bacterium]|nr:hemolysin III family protein [Fibrobacteria bacterium]